MGLKCSLLGHAFKEADVERERSEAGDEVVTVVREVERCARCGAERVVSENTEVTAVVEPEEVADDGGGEAMSSIVDRAGTADAGERDVRSEGAASSGTEADAGGAPGPAREEQYEPPDDPAEEDAEILEDDGPTDRQPGQWPDDDEPFNPDGVSGAADEDADIGTEPESTDESAVSGGKDEGEESSDPTQGPERTTLGGVDAAEATYVCGSCGFSTPAASSSLREGDACPDCGAGWLQVERNR